jgi:hypothetical protein
MMFLRVFRWSQVNKVLWAIVVLLMVFVVDVSSLDSTSDKAMLVAFHVLF